MARRVRYHPLFDCDVREAALWYDERSNGLGNAFVDVVHQSTADVMADPEWFGRSSIGCRYVRLPRFPYVLLFDVVEDEILMLGVMHTARSMEKWRGRQQDV